MKPLISEKVQFLTRCVFENLRNTVICASVSVAGVWLMKHHELSLFGPYFADWIGFALIVVAVLLAIANWILGAWQFLEHLSPPKWGAILFLLCFFLFYIAISSFFVSFANYQIKASSIRVAPAALSETNSTKPH